ncbi:MAG: deoxynucleoside kinase [Deltaproteobacteria bacterium]|nr:deoxynucleoside kinase [Deltaproteobacteria bacterium]
MKGKTSGVAAKPAEPKLFISMAGNIGCGKTTAAKLISQKWGYELFDEPVIDNRFLKDYYADMRRWSFTLQLEFLIKRAEHHELIRTVPKACIQDRTLIEDPEIFAKYLHGLGNMDDRELQLYLEYFQKLNRTLQQPDKVVFLEVKDVGVLMDRIGHRGRAEERGLTREFLEGLNAYYSTFPGVCRRKYGIEVMTVDASKVDLRTKTGRLAFLDLVSPFVS